MTNIKENLVKLKELDAHLDVIRMDKAAAIDLVLTSEIKAQLKDIDIEYDEISEAIRTTAATLEAEVRAAVLEIGASTKKSDNHYGAAFVRGKVSWDTKALDGYAVAHPELGKFRKVGQPSARINKKA